MSEYYHFCADTHNKVGRRIMEFRIIRGLSRTDIIERSMIPLTLAVLEKTETTQYCLDAQQLSEIARILEVPTIRFFQSLEDDYALLNAQQPYNRIASKQADHG